MSQHKRILEDVRTYYTDKISGHGATPQGVDWNSEASQTLRFDQLLRVVGMREGFSLIDYGCGYGALLEYMTPRFGPFRYSGYDLSDEMIAAAAGRHPSQTTVQWHTDADRLTPCDYVVASGIFNVRLQHDDTLWRSYITDTLRTMDSLATKGFSFNMLTSYSDKEHMKDYLYYADPSFYFDYCKSHFSRHVALLHDYPLYEFTLLVRK